MTDYGSPLAVGADRTEDNGAAGTTTESTSLELRGVDLRTPKSEQASKLDFL